MLGIEFLLKLHTEEGTFSTVVFELLLSLQGGFAFLRGALKLNTAQRKILAFNELLAKRAGAVLY